MKSTSSNQSKQTMKNLIYCLFLLVSFGNYAQQTFEYEFDERISLNVPEETEEGELSNGKFIRGNYQSEVITLSSSNKAKDRLSTMGDADVAKLFDGVKDANLKSTKGTLIAEEMTKLKNVKALRFKFSFLMDDQTKIVESYVFAYKNIVYTLQFMNNENEFEQSAAFRKSILDSISFR